MTGDAGGFLIGAVPRADGAISALACARARTAGVALAPLLRAANLAIEQLEDTRVRCSARDQVRLLNVVADALSDDLLGFHLARDCDLRHMGLLYYVMASSETALEAVRRGVRYGVLVNEGVLQHCSVAKRLSVGFRYVGISRHLDRHQSECWMLLIVRVLRQITGLRLSGQSVRFVHVRKKSPREFAPYFGDRITFGAAVDEICFPLSTCALPIVGADAYLNQLLVRQYEEALAHRRPGRGSFRAMAENEIVPLLPHGEVRIGGIARRLGLSQRTLARKLSAEGLTYTELLSQLRQDLARGYLADRDTSISQIAWLLGYQEVSAFSKAFKRWTGKAPREVRVSKGPRV